MNICPFFHHTIDHYLHCRVSATISSYKKDKLCLIKTCHQLKSQLYVFIWSLLCRRKEKPFRRFSKTYWAKMRPEIILKSRRGHQLNIRKSSRLTKGRLNDDDGYFDGRLAEPSRPPPSGRPSYQTLRPCDWSTRGPYPQDTFQGRYVTAVNRKVF